MRSIIKSAVAGLLVTFAQCASAIEVGDTFYVSNGIDRTVTKIVKNDGLAVELVAQVLKANAAESCENFMMVKPNTKEMNSCIAKTIGKPERYKVSCLKPAITTGGITYRPSDPEDTSDPWNAVNKRNLIMKGEDLFEKACR